MADLTHPEPTTAEYFIGDLARQLGTVETPEAVAAAVADLTAMPTDLRDRWATPAFWAGVGVAMAADELCVLLALASPGGHSGTTDALVSAYRDYCSSNAIVAQRRTQQHWVRQGLWVAQHITHARLTAGHDYNDVDLSDIAIGVIDAGVQMLTSVVWAVDMYVEINQRADKASWVWDVGWVRTAAGIDHLQPWRRGQATTAQGAVKGARTDLAMLVAACKTGLRDPFTHRFVSPGAMLGALTRFTINDVVTVVAEMFPTEHPAAGDELFSGLPHVNDLHLRTYTAAVLDWAGVPLPPSVGSGSHAPASSPRFVRDLADQGLEMDPAVAHYLAGADAHPGSLAARHRHHHGVLALRAAAGPDAGYLPGHLDDVPAYRNWLAQLP